MVKVFQSLAREGLIEHTICSARDYRPLDEHHDHGWIPRFKEDGGQVVIGGDLKMKENTLERLALAQAGMISFYFAGRWCQAKLFVKSAMLLNWWPCIESQMKEASSGECWEIPYQWSWTELRDVSPRPDLGIQPLRPKGSKPKLAISNE